MQILWLTPVHSGSAIARFSELVIEKLLAKGIRVVVGSSQEEDDPSNRRKFLDLEIETARKRLESVEDYDAIIVNFGDHFPNHASGLRAVQGNAVIGIFHDADMTNFRNGLRVFGNEVSGIDINQAPNVTSLIAGLCGGAVVHSSFYRDVVLSCDGPVRVIPLAWASGTTPVPQAGSRELSRVVTFGNININKCPDRVIRAIASSPSLRRDVEYRLIGSITLDMRERLEGLARSLDVKLIVRGAVSDDELGHELESATVVSCLREPVLEGASASAIEAMMCGCPTIVSNAGFYADLPNDCVVKIPAKSDVDSIRSALERIIGNTDARTELAHRASSFALRTFTAGNYVESLVALIEEVRITTAYWPLINRVGAQLRELHIPVGSPAATYILSAMEAMVPATRRNDNLTDLSPI